MDYVTRWADLDQRESALNAELATLDTDTLQTTTTPIGQTGG